MKYGTQKHVTGYLKLSYSAAIQGFSLSILSYKIHDPFKRQKDMPVKERLAEIDE